jgi:RNA polymerase sigma-70 factor, ECF subfamily
MDRTLVEQAMAGDRAAFSELVRHTIDRLYAVARLILRDPEQAEDATQEALVAAWRDLSSLRDPSRFDAWLHRLLVNACYREARRQRRRTEREVHEILIDRPDAAAEIDLADRDQLERGFVRIDADERAILVLHYYLGYSLAGVADVLGVPPGTAKSRLHRATQALRSALDAEARISITKAGQVA